MQTCRKLLLAWLLQRESNNIFLFTDTSQHSFMQCWEFCVLPNSFFSQKEWHLQFTKTHHRASHISLYFKILPSARRALVPELVAGIVAS